MNHRGHAYRQKDGGMTLVLKCVCVRVRAGRCLLSVSRDGPGEVCVWVLLPGGPVRERAEHQAPALQGALQVNPQTVCVCECVCVWTRCQLGKAYPVGNVP